MTITVIGGLGFIAALIFAILIIVVIAKLNQIQIRIVDIRIALIAMAGDKVKRCPNDQCGQISLARAKKCHACGTVFAQKT